MPDLSPVKATVKTGTTTTNYEEINLDAGGGAEVIVTGGRLAIVKTGTGSTAYSAIGIPPASSMVYKTGTNTGVILGDRYNTGTTGATPVSFISLVADGS